MQETERKTSQICGDETGDVTRGSTRELAEHRVRDAAEKMQKKSNELVEIDTDRTIFGSGRKQRKHNSSTIQWS